MPVPKYRRVRVERNPAPPETLTLTRYLIVLVPAVRRDPESRPIHVSARMSPCLVMVIDIPY